MQESTVFAGFASAVNPTAEELRAWANDPAAGPPQIAAQWDLLLADDPLMPTLVELAADPMCPKRTFALHCLYLYAADAVRTGFRAHPRRRVRRLLEQAAATQDAWVLLWVHNTKALISDPELFDYKEWCQGGLARRPRRL
ncbi:hypothetical protein LX16_2147 [Stackebrandtia albiflava]|uniref:Uncharacterized protein n=1 Tax=Stackebrandtia albiflava TaxID=406432 RepID=A0A562V0L5_9ACTN|nr:hypothetical protein [Stackebrandtia albiflava]TWJ11428.1 hypothetical protein LX16_2147 [Stackebrandtia albiflava]